jgi:hypothetical protein
LYSGKSEPESLPLGLLLALGESKSAGLYSGKSEPELLARLLPLLLEFESYSEGLYEGKPELPPVKDFPVKDFSVVLLAGEVALPFFSSFRYSRYFCLIAHII